MCIVVIERGRERERAREREREREIPTAMFLTTATSSQLSSGQITRNERKIINYSFRSPIIMVYSLTSSPFPSVLVMQW